MNGFEKIIKIVRDEIARNIVKYPLKIAEMTSLTSCKYGNIELDKDDLYFAEHLMHPQTNKKNVKLRPTGGTWQNYEKEDIEDGSDKWLSKSQLKAGDKVLIIRVSEDKFAVIERLVEI